MTIRDYLVSVIRTIVPAAVGAVLSWLATIGLDLGEQANAGLVTAMTAAAIGLYYILIRALEAKWPAFGVLLGLTRPPTYDPVEPEYVGEVRARLPRP